MYLCMHVFMYIHVQSLKKGVYGVVKKGVEPMTNVACAIELTHKVTSICTYVCIYIYI